MLRFQEIKLRIIPSESCHNFLKVCIEVLQFYVWKKFFIFETFNHFHDYCEFHDHKNIIMLRPTRYPHTN